VVKPGFNTSSGRFAFDVGSESMIRLALLAARRTLVDVLIDNPSGTARWCNLLRAAFPSRSDLAKFVGVKPLENARIRVGVPMKMRLTKGRTINPAAHRELRDRKTLPLASLGSGQ